MAGDARLILVNTHYWMLLGIESRFGSDGAKTQQKNENKEQK